MSRSDVDLLELGGYWAYKYKQLVINQKIVVNQKEYTVIDIHDNENGNGLEAITVIDGEGQVSIIYVGTNPDQLEDRQTDAGLLTQGTPEQFLDAVKYYEEMEQKIREHNAIYNTKYEIKYVGGNSLGGGLANYVASRFPGLFSVTLDPAPLPYGIEPGVNAINYVANTSPLFLASKAAGLIPGRFPGQFVFVEYGIFSLFMLTQNHLGYNGEAVGDLRGEGIDDILPFSIWGGGIIPSGGVCLSKININSETLEQLVNSLGHRMEKIKSQLIQQLDPVYEEIKFEKSRIVDRIDVTLNETDEITRLFFGTIVNVSEHITNMKTIVNGIGVETANIPALGELGAAIIDIGQWKVIHGIPKMVEDSTSGFTDGFVEKLEKHHEVIDENLHIMLERWSYVAEAAKMIKQQFSALDEAIKSRIGSGDMRSGDIPIPSIERPTRKMVESVVFKDVRSAIDSKKAQLDENFAMFNFDFTNLLRNIIRIINACFLAIKPAIKNTKNQHKNNISGLKHSIGLLNTNYAGETDPDKIEEKDNKKAEFSSEITNSENIVTEMDRLLNLIAELQDVIKVQKNNIPKLLPEFKPYFNHLLFSNTKYGNIQMQIQASLYLINNGKLMFDEIWQRIAATECQGIEDLRIEAKATKDMLSALEEQLKIVAI